MSLRISLHTLPEVPFEADCLSPDKVQSLGSGDIEKMTVLHGNRQHRLGDFFSVTGTFDGTMELVGDLRRVKHIGAGMTSGEVFIQGDVGEHLGTTMSGGSIRVEGNAADWVAPEMRGGRVEIRGNAGHMVGSSYRGSLIGMTGGEILIQGNARNELGHGMRNGLIAVGGASGDFTGVDMLAGTIIVAGQMGIRAGAGMKRGSVISMSPAQMLPTFGFACRYRPVFLIHYLHYLQRAGLPIRDEHRLGRFDRWCGDAVELNRGEILLYAP